MTAPEFARLVLEVCSLSLPPTIPVERLSAYAMVESGRNPNAISQPNRDGTRDFGIMQVNSSWLRRLRLTERQIMQPCTNLRVGMMILQDADRQASCIYNTGRPGCRNGYDQRIVEASLGVGRFRAPARAEPDPVPVRRAAPITVVARPAGPGRRPASNR